MRRCRDGVSFVAAKPSRVLFAYNASPSMSRHCDRRNRSISGHIQSYLLWVNSSFQVTSFWMVSSTFKQCWGFDHWCINPFNSSINNRISKSFVYFILSLFLFFLLCIRTVFLLLSFSVYFIDKRSKIKFFKVIVFRLFLSESFHKLFLKIVLIGFTGCPFSI